MKPMLTKDMTLNAIVRQFPQLLEVLHAAGLTDPWWGSETLEEAAWYHGLSVEHLLAGLKEAVGEPAVPEPAV